MAPGLRLGLLLPALTQSGLDGVLCVGHQPDIGEAMTAALGGDGLRSHGDDRLSPFSGGIGSGGWVAGGVLESGVVCGSVGVR